MDEDYEDDIEIEDIENDVDKYDISSSEKLLKSIRLLNDLPNVKVPRMGNDYIGYVTVNTWINDFIRKIEWVGVRGWESEVIILIKSIDDNNQRIMARCEEGFRKLLMVMDRQEKRIKQYKDIIDKQKNTIEELENVKNEEQVDNDKDVEVEVVPKVEKEKFRLGSPRKFPSA